MAGSDESGKSWPPPAGNHWRFGAQPSSDKDAPTHPRAALIGSEPGNMRSCGRKSDGTRAQLTPVGWPRVHWSGGRTRTSDAPCHVARTSADQVVVAAGSQAARRSFQKKSRSAPAEPQRVSSRRKSRAETKCRPHPMLHQTTTHPPGHQGTRARERAEWSN